jgi:predicted transcriptional regulator
MVKRRRVEIVAAILNSAVDGVKKTRIMQNANLSYSLLEKYLGETIGLGFLQFDNESYATTEKGREFLEVYLRFSLKHSRLKEMLEASRSDWEVLEQMCDLGPDCSPKLNGVRLNHRSMNPEPRAVAESVH